MTLVCEQVAVHRGHATTLADVSLCFQPGTITALLGENGAGKSTLLAVAAGLLQPATGAVHIHGMAMLGLTPLQRARHIGWLPPVSSSALGLSARQIVELGLYAAAVPTPSTVDAALVALELEALSGRPVAELSSGEQQRVGLARILAQLHADGAPAGRFALLDEPSSALDVRHQLLVAQQLRLLATAGAGVVAAIHDVNFAMELADHLVVLKRGRVLFSGPTSGCTSATLDEAFGVSFRLEHRLVARLTAQP
jgi:iron complex transport system ATP-binding protein